MLDDELMTRIAGIIATMPQNNAGRIFFILHRVENQHPVLCCSSPQCQQCTAPGPGALVRLDGDHTNDCFLFDSLSVVSSL
jgi:hypothetical protein